MRLFAYRRIFMLVLGISAGVLMLVAQGFAHDRVVHIGEQIPHFLQAQDQNNKRQNFETLSGEKGLLLVFVRSAQWCSYCQLHLNDLNTHIDAFENMGVAVVSVSNDTADNLRLFSDGHQIKFTMLADPESEIIKAYGVLNRQKNPDDKHYGIAVPGIYYINALGEVEGELFLESYKIRPSVEDIIEILPENVKQ